MFRDIHQDFGPRERCGSRPRQQVFADIADPQRFERLAAAAGEPEPPLLERTFSPSAFRECAPLPRPAMISSLLIS